MRNLGKTWLVKVRFSFKRYWASSWENSGIITDNFIIEEDDFLLAGQTIINHIRKGFSNPDEYKNVIVEVYDVSEYEVPSNFLVKEY